MQFITSSFWVHQVTFKDWNVKDKNHAGFKLGKILIKYIFMYIKWEYLIILHCEISQV